MTLRWGGYLKNSDVAVAFFEDFHSYPTKLLHFLPFMVAL